MIKLKELLLKEYVDTDIVKLWKYLDSTPDQKFEEITNMLGYDRIINKYFNIERLVGITSPTYQKYDAVLRFGNLQNLKTRDPKTYKEIRDNLGFVKDEDAQDFINFMERNGIGPQDAPSWLYLKQPTLLKNQWLVHGTTFLDGRMMVTKGFIKGINDPTKVGLTTWLEGEKIGEGYNFAYTPEDFAQYGFDGEATKYGDGTLLVFRASGIRCWHSGDDEYQTIFNGKTARDIVLIREVMGTYAIYSKNGNPLVHTDVQGKSSPTDLVDWVVNNYDQYRKSIGWEKPR